MMPARPFSSAAQRHDHNSESGDLHHAKNPTVVIVRIDPERNRFRGYDEYEVEGFLQAMMIASDWGSYPPNGLVDLDNDDGRDAMYSLLFTYHSIVQVPGRS